MQARLRWKLNEAQAAGGDFRTEGSGRFHSGGSYSLDAPLPLSSPCGPEYGALDKHPLLLGRAPPDQQVEEASLSLGEGSRPQVSAYTYGDDDEQEDGGNRHSASASPDVAHPSAVLEGNGSYGQEFMEALTLGVIAVPPDSQQPQNSSSEDMLAIRPGGTREI